MLDKITVRIDRAKFRIDYIDVLKYESNIIYKYKHDIDLENMTDFVIEMNNISLYYYNNFKFQLNIKNDYVYVSINPSHFPSYNMFDAYMKILGVTADSKITRLDICSDHIDYSMDQIHYSLFGLNQRKTNIWYGSSGVETIYIGKMPVMLRAYNKTLELEQKYFKTTVIDGVETTVSRIELQIRRPEKLMQRGDDFVYSDVRSLLQKGIDNYFKFNYRFQKVSGLDKFKLAYLQLHGIDKLRKHYAQSKHLDRFNDIISEEYDIIKCMDLENKNWYQSRPYKIYKTESLERKFRLKDSDILTLDAIKERSDVSEISGVSESLDKLEMLSLITLNGVMEYVITPVGFKALEQRFERLIILKQEASVMESSVRKIKRDRTE